jgi:hypothetical protein
MRIRLEGRQMTKLSTLVAAFALSLSASPSAQSRDWRVATIDERAVSFVDAKSLERTGNHVRFRFEVHFRDKRDVARMSAHVFANCKAMSVTDIEASGYRIDGSSADVSDALKRSAKPGSNLAGLIEGTCTGNWLTGAQVDPPNFASKFFSTL